VGHTDLMQIQSKSYFYNLDGLRIILAFIVLGSHAMLAEVINAFVPFDILKRFVVVFNSGNLAVSFFFVLSGFLITYLMIEEKEVTGKFSIRHFYIRRIYRIWPLYYVVLIFGFFIYPFIKSLLGYVNQNPYSPIHQIFFLGNFDSIRVHEAGLIGVAPMMIAINWSVSIEEQFYLLWPLAFLLIKPNRFWVICLLVIAGSWIFRLTSEGSSLYYHTLSVISDMAIGALSAWLVFYSSSFRKFFKELPRYAIFSLYALGFLTLMYNDRFGGYFLSRSYRVISGMFFCFIIVEQCFASNSLFKFGNWSTISSAGKYSFALYMLHPIGIQTSIVLFRILHIERDQNTFIGLLYYLIAATVSMILSIMSYHFFERYFLEKRKKFY
jgi:peptidoglycan/LPS O-acetylase OafA/YrhL